MAEGETDAVFEGLAKDAGDAGGEISNPVQGDGGRIYCDLPGDAEPSRPPIIGSSGRRAGRSSRRGRSKHAGVVMTYATDEAVEDHPDFTISAAAVRAHMPAVPTV